MCKAELKEGLPPEDHYDYLQFASVFDDFLDRSAESAERTVRNLDRLSDGEVDFRLGCVLGVLVLTAQDTGRLLIPDGDGDTLVLAP